MKPNPLAGVLRVLALLNLVALGVLLFSLLWRQTNDFDIWLHLAAGRWILEHRGVPHQDIFSFTRVGHEWVDLYWLFQIAVFLAYDHLQAFGLIALKLIWIGAAWGLVFGLPGFSRSSLLTLLAFALGVFAANSVYSERPGSLSLLFLALTLSVLWRWRQNSSPLLYLLPFTQMIWTNCHSLFVLGLFLIGCYWAEAGLVLLWRGRTDPQALTRFKKISVVLLLSIVAGVVTPYGWHGLLFPFQLFLEMTGRFGKLNIYISELRPPLSGYSAATDVWVWEALLALGAASWILNARRLQVSLLLIWIGFAYLSWISARNLAIFSLVAAPVIAFNCKQWQETHAGCLRRKPWPRLARAGVFLVGLVLLAEQAALAVRVFTNRFSPSSPFGTGIVWSAFPAGAAEFIAEQKIPGPGFNAFEDGGYLIWRLYPAYPVFTDGCFEVSGTKFFNRYIQLLRDPSHFSEWLEHDSLRYALLRHPQPNNLPALTWFLNQPGFALVYLDSVSALFVLRSAVPPDWLAAHELRLQDLPPIAPPSFPTQLPGWRQRWLTRYWEPAEALDLARIEQKLQMPNRAMHEFIQAEEQAPECAEAWIGIGGLLLAQGQESEALRYLNFGLRLNPNSLNGHSLMAKALAASDPEAAFSHLQALARLRPDDSRIRNNLAVYFLQHGQPAKALEEIEAGRRDPFSSENPVLDLNQALADLDLKKLSEAKPLLARYLDRMPEDAGVHFLLGNLLWQMGNQAEARAHLEFARARHYQPPGGMAYPDRPANQP